MGFELLTEETDNDGGDSGDSESPLLISELFEESFPYYLSIGMTAEQYWDDDPSLVRAYRKAHDIITHRRNAEMWLEGKYVYDAMCCLIPSHQLLKPKPPLDYLDEPYPLTKKEVQDRELKRQMEEQRKMREKIQNSMMAMRAKKTKQEEQGNE